MKHFIDKKIIGGAVIALLLSVGLAHAQSNTLTFDNGTCSSVATCTKGPGASGGFVQIDGSHFFFFENLVIGSQQYAHVIVADKGDSNGGAFQQEAFTKGSGFFIEQNTSSIGAVTFKQYIGTTGHTSVVTMDALNLIQRGSGPDQAPATQLSVMQNITDPLYGLTVNKIVMTPKDPNAAAPTDFGTYTPFNTHVDQTMTGAGGFNSTVNFDVGQQITPKETF